MYDILRLYVYHDGVRVGMAESADSLQWMPAFDDLGEFKLVCAATETNRALLVLDAVLYNPDTPSLAAVVLAAEADGDNYRMTVRGKFSLCLFKRRTARGSRTITDGAAGLLEVCRTNLRGLGVAVPPAAGFTAPCEETVAWTDCASAAVQLMQAGGFGGRVRFDPATAAQTLELLQGKDRSVPGTALYNGYFSTRMQNLSGAVYTQDASDYANVVLCGGEEPGENDSFTRYFCELGDMTASGNARRELWVDGSSVRHKYTVQNADGTTSDAEYSEAEYQAAVQNYARAALKNHMSTRQLKCTAANTNLIYGTDYELGDLVPVRVEELGLNAVARVASIRLIYESTGGSLRPVLDHFTFKE